MKTQVCRVRCDGVDDCNVIGQGHGGPGSLVRGSLTSIGIDPSTDLHGGTVLQSRSRARLVVFSRPNVCHMYNADPEFDLPIRPSLLSESGSGQWQTSSHSKIRSK
jgi:hypothetical protein